MNKHMIDAKDLEKVVSLRSLFALSLDWMMIIASFLIAIRGPAIFWPLCALIIATRQHALLVLLHEQVHFHFIKNKYLGEWITDLFCGFPLLVSTQLYRRTHFLHHEYLNSPRDPDWIFMRKYPEWSTPQSKKDLWRLIFKDLSGLHLRENLIRGPVQQMWSPLPRLLLSSRDPRSISFSERFLFCAFWITAILAIVVLEIPLVIPALWLTSLSLVLPALVRLRALPEHAELPAHNPTEGSRSITATAFEKFLISPHGINYHREHHQNPRIPFYHLPDYGKRLENNGTLSLPFTSYGGSEGAWAQMISRTRLNHFSVEPERRFHG